MKVRTAKKYVNAFLRLTKRRKLGSRYLNACCNYNKFWVEAQSDKRLRQILQSYKK